MTVYWIGDRGNYEKIKSRTNYQQTKFHSSTDSDSCPSWRFSARAAGSPHTRLVFDRTLFGLSGWSHPATFSQISYLTEWLGNEDRVVSKAEPSRGESYGNDGCIQSFSRQSSAGFPDVAPMSNGRTLLLSWKIAQLLLRSLLEAYLSGLRSPFIPVKNCSEVVL